MRINFWKVSTLALAAALGLSLTMPSADAERQPHMKNALGYLNSARTELSRATADKGGHRVKAMAAVDEAIVQVKKGMAFDNKN